MASLTAVISWELFKNDTSFSSLDKYTRSLLNQFSIPSNFLDLCETSSDGVSVSALPSDCLHTVFTTLSQLREMSEWNPGYESILTFLCLIARRRDNRPSLLVYDYLVAVDSCLEHFLCQARHDATYQNQWTDTFKLGSRYIEWLFDPETTWRTWRKSMHSGQLPPGPVLPQKGNAYASSWLRDLIVNEATKLHFTHLKLALDLMCAEVATSTTAAWTTLSQELLASLMTAAIASDDQDVERFNAIIECLTFLLQRLFVMDE
uniref:Mediator of RNA polymerase II transcription subunit 23 n=1 Tax=Mesocestoides corti TaxID=53468 RepID=A0A5K3EFK4_MESCO